MTEQKAQSFTTTSTSGPSHERLQILSRHIRATEGAGAFAVGLYKTHDFRQRHKEKSSILRYTLDNPRLSRRQREFYEINGYVVIKNLVEPEFIDELTGRFQDICNGRVKVPFMTVMKDVSQKDKSRSETTVNKLQDLFLDEKLFSYCQHPQILDYVECFCGPNVMAIHSMLINKPPDSGALTSRHPLHQDLMYFPIRPADRIVATWTAMEPVTRENGCLVVIPGTHQGQLMAHDYPKWEGGVNALYYGIQDLPEELMEKRIHLEMDKGDTVFFHPLLIHGSGTNRSQRFRKAISCHYAAAECNYIEVEGSMQEKLAQEIIQVAKKKGIHMPGYKELWEMKAQLVRGERINL